MSEDKIVLGEYELVGKNRAGEVIELVFLSERLKGDALRHMRFDKGNRSSVLITDREVAKTLHDAEKFRIVLERIPD